MVYGSFHREGDDLGRRLGDTPVRRLRTHYGDDFAAGCADSEKLRDVLDKLDEPSLRKLLRDNEDGKLEQICNG